MVIPILFIIVSIKLNYQLFIIFISIYFSLVIWKFNHLVI